MKAATTWVLVADGKRAQVFEHGGPGSGLTPVHGLHFDKEKMPSLETANAVAGDGHKTIEVSDNTEDTDRVGIREGAFIKQVAAELDRRHQANAFSRLVIAAAPATLGHLRQEISPRLKSAVTAELPKDLTQVPLPELGSHFEDIFAV